MNILIAPDKFKGSLSALEVAEAIAKGLNQALPEITCILHPLADGGDGSVQVLQSYLDLEEVTVQVPDPLGNPLQASYHIHGQEAFVELAQASGLILVPEQQRNPLETSTYGTGLLIRDALEKGAKKIFLFLGGSATNDGGIGIAQALGMEFLDKKGDTLEPKGKSLGLIDRIIPSSYFAQTQAEILCLCDVKNPLLGPNGATYVYGPQKGASPAMADQLEKGMENYAQVVEQQFRNNIREIEGGGAAGGISAGLFGMFGANIQSGIDTLLELSKFEERLQEADAVISGEGRLDTQTLEGKVIKGVLDLCKVYGKELILFVGQNQLADEVWQDQGVIGVTSILSHAKNVDDAIENAESYLAQITGEYFDRRRKN